MSDILYWIGFVLLGIAALGIGGSLLCCIGAGLFALKEAWEDGDYSLVIGIIIAITAILGFACLGIGHALQKTPKATVSATPETER